MPASKRAPDEWRLVPFNTFLSHKAAADYHLAVERRGDVVKGFRVSGAIQNVIDNLRKEGYSLGEMAVYSDTIERTDGNAVGTMTTLQPVPTTVWRKDQSGLEEHLRALEEITCVANCHLHSRRAAQSSGFGPSGGFALRFTKTGFPAKTLLVRPIPGPLLSARGLRNRIREKFSSSLEPDEWHLKISAEAAANGGGGSGNPPRTVPPGPRYS